MNILKKIAVLLTAVWLVLFTALPAFCAEEIDPDRHISLTIHYTYEGMPLDGTDVNIFQVATVDEYGKLTTTERFEGYNVNIEDGDEEAWRELATTLEGYVLRDNLEPTDTQTTDKQGVASFPSKGVRLPVGLYLVLGTRYTKDDIIYESLPFIVHMPTQNPHNDEWYYDVILKPKYELISMTGTKTVDCKVLKAWDDKGHEDMRPKQIVMQLLCDGEIYDTVTLTEKNNWRYEWNDLDATHQWRVVEKELEDYTVLVSREGITFLITNTFFEKEAPTGPDATNEPTEQGTPENPSNPDATDSSTPNATVKPVTPDTTLPQTGQLWWPVSLLSAAGLLLIAIGVSCLRGRKNEEK